MKKQRHKMQKLRRKLFGKAYRTGEHYDKPKTANGFDLKEGEGVILVENETTLMMCGRGVA